MTAGSHPPRVVAVAGDAGGANALAPVIEMLLAEKRPVSILAYKQACQVWARRGLAFQEIPEITHLEDAQKRLESFRAERLLTGTSYNGVDLEKQFVAAARPLGVPSLAVLDFWSHYRLRFENRQGDWFGLPDRIGVMDERARAEMIALGFEEDRLQVTGQPAFDELAELRQRIPQVRKNLRGRLGIRPDERLILFASQPLAALFGADRSNPLYSGYTEHTVLKSLTAALNRIGRRRTEKIVLLVRPHPREDAAALQNVQLENARAIVDGQGDGREAALAAELVTGMSTVLLVEACLLGQVVVSIQPGLSVPDVLPTNRWGASRAVYNDDEIEPVLESLLFDDKARAETAARAAQFSFEPGATGRVVRLLDSLAPPGKSGGSA